MKGSILMGELPDFLAGAEFETKVDLLCEHVFFSSLSCILLPL